MIQDSSPITPPPELVREWAKTCSPYEVPADHIATQAARWGADQQLKLDTEQINQAWQKGADQELEACCEWIVNCKEPFDELDLHNARRPKPLSLKEQALALISHDPENQPFLSEEGIAIIRRALEQLND